MSLRTFTSRFLTLRPWMRFSRDAIRIEDNRVIKLAKLGINVRTTTFRLDRKVMEHRVRTWWFRPKESLVPFSELSHIDYDYASAGTSWGWSYQRFGRQDEVDSFRISVVGKSGKRHSICSFHGEGAVETGWLGTLFGDDAMLDFAGTQEGESRQFVHALSRLLGIHVGQPITDRADMATCPSCGHPTSRHTQKCLYCGASISPCWKQTDEDRNGD